MSTRINRHILVLLSALFSIVIPGQAQTGATPEAQNPKPTQNPTQVQDEKPDMSTTSTVLRVKSRLVLVDVVVQDNKGRAITDLKADDFTVLEEGKAQRIQGFRVMLPTEHPALEAPPKLPPNVFTNIPTYKKNSAFTILLLDALNSQVNNQERVRAKMLEFLQKLPADQTVAVYTLGSRLQMLQDFTSDPALLREAVKQVKPGPSPIAGGADDVLYPADFMQSIAAFAPNVVERMVQFQQETKSFRTDNRVRLTLDALESLGRSLSGFPGRKNLIWVSESFPFVILPTATLNPAVSGADRDYSVAVAKTANVLSSAQVAIYPVDARGLIGSEVFSADASNTDISGNTVAAQARRGNTSGMTAGTFQDARESHDTMNALAERTGGKAFYNRNDLDAMVRESVNDGSSYYILAYSPEDKNWNGKFRKIVVKTNRSGAKVRHRLGYFADDTHAYAKMDPAKRSREFSEALNLAFPIATTLAFETAVFPPTQNTGYHVVINYGIDAHSLVFDPKADGTLVASVDCAAAIYTEKGKLVKMDANSVSPALTPELYAKVMKSGFPCRQTLDLPAGSYLLRVGVRDAQTGLLGTANATLTVPAATQNAPADKKP